jgi:Big-like domain-containing protein
MKRIGVSLAVMIAFACGSNGPGTPTQPSVTSVTVSSSSDLLFMGAFEIFTATTNLGPATGASWSSDALSIATADSSSGRITGVGTGRATISADVKGVRGTKLIRVLPNYGGSWSGSYAINDCQSTSTFAQAGFCSSFFRGQILNMNLSISQSRDAVTASFALGSLVGSGASGTVSEPGSVPLAGGVVSSTFRIDLQNFVVDSPQPGVITGHFDQVWSGGGFSGTARIISDIRTMNRTSTAALTLEARVPAAAPVTLDDLIRLVTIRR